MSLLSTILRPTLCHIASAVSSPQSLQRIFIPVASTVNHYQGSSLNVGYQTRGYRKKIDVSKLKPLNFDYSEDLVKQEPLNPDEIVFKYRGIKEIDELPPDMKKLFTLGLATSRERLEHRSAVLLEKVSNVLGPGPCLEKEICYMTVKIRNLIPYIISDRRNKCHKTYLINRIFKRKKLLRALRKLDYDRYMWLLKELQVTCSPVNPYEYFKFRTTGRRATLKRETREAVLAEKKRKLEEIKAELTKEKEKFFDLKGKIFEEIDRDIKEYGLDKVEVLTKFQKRLAEQQRLKMESQKKISKKKQIIEEMKLQKIRDSRIF